MKIVSMKISKSIQDKIKETIIKKYGHELTPTEVYLSREKRIDELLKT